MDIALKSSVWVTSPEFAGWLQKRGFHWRKLWKNRWLALHGAEIVYMDKEPTLENSTTMVMTKAKITSATIIEPDDIDGNELGFKVNINDGKSPTWCLRADSDLEKKNWLTRLNHVIAIVRWLEEYEKVRVLGVGGTGVVYELLHKTNSQKYAMKEMEIKNKAQMQMALKEAEMLKDIMENISHKNIMHIEKVFQVGSKFYLVFPLCTGGELYEHIIRRGHFTEYDAAALTRDLVGGLHALHVEDILHLDIKPENILFDSQAPDANIKITDFGLSRMLEGESLEAPMPTMAELNLKIVQFFESGILNRERLRGTVGYMSPELILCGHCSKATDIFAAGVVLYILLCGRPPFQSKSNREVLERTCRGQYTMDGPQWSDVSEEAKDLVKRMLMTDPAKRITAAEVLQHSWLSHLDVSESETTERAAGDGSAPGARVPSTAPRVISKSIGSGLSLGSLRVLSGHVQARRSEKLASSFTRLVSSLQSGAWRGTSLLSRQIQLADGSPLPDIACRDEDMMVLQNPDIRQALTTVIARVCTDGKMPVEQFICVLRHFGMGPGPAYGPVSTLPGLFLCRFIDRDGDGFISADDLFTTQALIMQKSELFLRAVFRMYTEAVWYPGRQLNLASYHRSPRKTASPQSGHTAILDSESGASADVVEPPKFITARNIGEVFSKIGYKPETGKHIFTVLCCVLKRRRDLMEGNAVPATTGPEKAEKLAAFAAYEAAAGKGAEPADTKDSPARDKAGHNPLEDSFDGANLSDALRLALLPEPPVTPTDTPKRASKMPPNANATDANPLVLHLPSKNSTSSNGSSNDIGDIEHLYPDDPEIQAAAVAMASSGTSKMDINDFMEACQMDDVLVQAVLRKPRQRFLELLDKLQVASPRNKAAEGGDSSSTERNGSGSERTSELDAAMGHGIDTSVLEEELIAALEKVEKESKSSFPLATAVKRATLHAAFGLVSTITGSTQNLLNGLSEAMLESSDDTR